MIKLQWSVIFHSDRKYKKRLCGAFQKVKDLLGYFYVTDVSACSLCSLKRADIKECIKSQTRQHVFSSVEISPVGVDADSTVAHFFQEQGQGVYRPSARNGPVGIESVNAKSLRGNPRQKGKFCAYGIGPPSGHIQGAITGSFHAQCIKRPQDIRPDARKQVAGIKKGFALYGNQVRARMRRHGRGGKGRPHIRQRA